MFYPVKVSKINRETSSAISIEFALDATIQDKFLFTPGQFLTVKADINGQDVRRSYSICSTPKSGVLKVAVKKIEGGVFSSYAVDSLKEGDAIELGVPAGKFTVTCDGNAQKKYLFVAAGSGITPVLSMIKTILLDEPLSKVQLIYGNKTQDQTIFFEELEALKSQYASAFSLSYVFSQEGADQGRINSERIVNELEEGFSLDTVAGIYLCGPQAMVEEVTTVLESKEASLAGKFHFELFTAATSQETANEEESNGDFEEAKVTANVDGVDYTFMVKAGKTILGSALSAGIDLPYSCQGGVCGSCECAVTKGKVDILQNMVLSDEEVEDGQTLACQAVPQTAEVKLDFDF